MGPPPSSKKVYVIGGEMVLKYTQILQPASSHSFPIRYIWKMGSVRVTKTWHLLHQMKSGYGTTVWTTGTTYPFINPPNLRIDREKISATLNVPLSQWWMWKCDVKSSTHLHDYYQNPLKMKIFSYIFCVFALLCLIVTFLFPATFSPKILFFSSEEHSVSPNKIFHSPLNWHHTTKGEFNGVIFFRMLHVSYVSSLYRPKSLRGCFARRAIT